MKCQIIKWKWLVELFLFLAPLSAVAGWQVSSPQTTMPREPFFQAGARQQQPKQTASLPSAYTGTRFPNQYSHLGATAPVYAMSISGSLKENLERIMSRYHWRVVWKAPVDYNFDGQVSGATLPNVIEKLLQPFPLQAVMYMSNRTVTIVPKYSQV